MKLKVSFLLTIAFSLVLGLASCSKDEPNGGGNDDNAYGKGDYGHLDGNLITIGSTRNVTYTSCVLLGTVDFPKITSDHSYGIVFMEALLNPNFDYEEKLVYGGHSTKLDKEEYDCIDVTINSSSVDGKFEKQIIGLKPATTYYYRAFVRIGNNVNYSKVESVTTQDPSPEITLATLDATDIYAVKATMKGGVNVGNLQDVNEDQMYGFIYTDAVQMSTPETLTYEYYEQWSANHFETEDEFDEPDEITTSENMNGRISCVEDELEPGKTYYYRTFFAWNGKYFYSPEVKSFKTLGAGEITVNTSKATEITANSAQLNGSFPISLIGKDTVRAGFMISKVYSHTSEFKMINAERWADHNRVEADIYYLDTYTENKDYNLSIQGLDPETTYYIVAYIYMGHYNDVDFYIYGNLQSFKTDSRPAGTIDEVTSTGLYPWTETAPGRWESGNAGINSSSSILTITFIPQSGQSLAFDLSVSSETKYDKVIIAGEGWESQPYSGTVNIHFVSPVYENSKETSVTVTYSKDVSNARGDDKAKVSHIELE